MNPTYSELLGRRAIYRGNNRRWLFGDIPYYIVDAKRDGSSVMLDVANVPERNCWVATTSVELVPLDEVSIFNDAAGTHSERLDAEIKRLEDRLAELKQARKVLDSL